MNSSINATRIFDYFVISGLDSAQGLVPNTLLDEYSAKVGPFEASFSPRVLEHYPEQVPWSQFDSSAVTTLCMPRGVHFSYVPKEISSHPREPQFHSFIITKENGAKVYGFSLIFYEQVQDESIINAITSLEKMHSAQVPEIPTNSTLLVREEPVSNSKSLPRHFKVTAPQLIEKKLDCSPKYDPSSDILLVSKSIILTGQYPFVEAARNFLSNFFKFAVHSSQLSSPQSHSLSSLSLESFVYYILFSIPLPSPNQCIVIPNVPSLGWRHSSNVLILQRPSSYVELPLCEYEIGKVVDLLGIDCLIQLWTCLLLESQVLIYSADYSRLMLVAESLTTLLFPFTWPHVYVPILPPAMYNFLDAPVPYLMGLSSLPANDSRLPSEANLCMVDIDNRTIDVPEELPPFPQRGELADELKEVLKKMQAADATNSSSSKQNRQTWSPLALAAGTNDNTPGVLERSEAYQRVTAIAKRTGVFCDDGHAFHQDLENSSSVVLNSDVERYLKVQKVNNAIREIFLNQFAHMFAVYEHFVIQPNQDLESWISNREMVHTFDKTTFLSDQPAPHLPFLSRFLESQMFASFIDSKVLANFGQPSHSVRVLDARIKLLKDGYGDSMVRTPGYEPCTWFGETAALLERRIGKPTVNPVTPFEVLPNNDVDGTPSTNHLEISENRSQTSAYPAFPSLNRSILTTAPNSTTSRKKGDKLRKKEKASIPKSYTIGSEAGVGIVDATRGTDPANNPSLLSGPMPPRPAVIAQGNWKFVEQLLQECKTKTKRLLVGKMGNEAIELGHGQVSISGVEDNTLIAGLCDLLERVWAHGLQTKQGKSALWSHILHYQDLKTAPMAVNKPVKASSLTPAYAFVTLRKKLQNLSVVSWDNSDSSADVGVGSGGGRLSSADQGGKQVQPTRMKPLPVSLIFDMRNVQSMTDIKTHLGYARAWVRLCLEKKLLFQHLTTLLSEENLLRTLYKRYAFLRCDDERDQFLYYLLSLNAVDYHCFTNTYTSSVITYRVFMATIRQSSMSSCRPYLLLSGTLANTQPLYFSSNRCEIVFQHKNLGILTTLRIGIDDSNGNGRWLMDHILVRNEVTGHTYKFPCGRWLGKDIEDGSTERLLVAGSYDHPAGSGSNGSSAGGEGPSSMDGGGNPTHSPIQGGGGSAGLRARSPSTTREGSSLTSSLTNLAGNLNINLTGGARSKLSVSEIQRLLGDAVNNLVKYYHRPPVERGTVTLLLCGELGLVPCLEMALHHGFRSSRIFSKNIFLWDYLMRVRELYTQDPRSVTSVQDYNNPRSDRAARTWLCDTIGKIQYHCPALGKGGKLQLLLCLAARDKMLHRMVVPLAACSATATAYEENSFLRDTRLRAYLHHILQTLSDFNIVLEVSITRGVD